MKKIFLIFMVLFSHLTLAYKKIAVFDIGTLPGGDHTSAQAINSKGLVIGFGNTKQSERRAFIWSKKSGIKEIGVLPGNTMSDAIAINSKGDVVGISFTDSLESYHYRTFIWNATEGLRDIGTLGGHYTIPSTLTENGSIVGTSQTQDNAWHAFIWKKDSGMTDLGTLSSNNNYSEALQANSNDEVAGISMTPQGLHPFLWSEQNAMQDIFYNIGADHTHPEYNYLLIVLGINSQGTLIGYDFNGYYPSFIWSKNDGMQDLGITCKPLAINDNDTIIGNCDAGSKQTAFVWKKGIGMQKSSSFYAVALSSNNHILGKLIEPISDRSGMVIWTEKNGLQELISIDNAIYHPRAINQHGQITGDRQIQATKPSHAFLAEYK